MGVYIALTQQGFYFDAQLRWDFYQSSLTDPNNGLRNQSLDMRGVSLTVNAGQNIPLGSGWFVEPSAGMVWSRVDVDTLKVPGLTDANGNVFARGSVTLEDITSVLGRATLRVGTTFTSGGIAWQPYLTASIIHDFDGDVTAKSLVFGTNNNSLENASLTLHSPGGLGTYGQFGLGTAAILGNSGWLGYGRVDYRTGENIEGWGVNAGLRYQW